MGVLPFLPASLKCSARMVRFNSACSCAWLALWRKFPYFCKRSASNFAAAAFSATCSGVNLTTGAFCFFMTVPFCQETCVGSWLPVVRWDSLGTGDWVGDRIGRLVDRAHLRLAEVQFAALAGRRVANVVSLGFARVADYGASTGELDHLALHQIVRVAKLSEHAVASCLVCGGDDFHCH